MRITFKSDATRRLALLAGLLSAGTLVGVPAIAQDSTTSPQAPAPTYPSTGETTGTSTTPDEPASTAPQKATADTTVTPASETDPATSSEATSDTKPDTAAESETPDTTAESETAPATSPEATSDTAPAPTAETAPTGTTATTADYSILELASSSGSFNTLAQAVEAAGLTETLSGEGPFTVFAPTDEAFAELPEGALEYLLQPENKALLQKVLSYHVAEGAITSDEVSTGLVETLGGGLAAEVSDSGVVINNASVLQADVEASNGVIHVINRVLLPEDVQKTLAQALGVNSIY